MWKAIRRERLQIICIFLILFLGVSIRLIAISYFADTQFKPVDVYYADTQAAQLILGFKNPYSHTYFIHDSIDVFAYLPFVPIYYAIFIPMGDIRYGSIFADVLIMLSVYWIAKAFRRGNSFLAPFAFAIFPISIWLTSVASTNIMIGCSFFALSIAALTKERYYASAGLLGLSLAANQLTMLALPLVGSYFLKQRKLHAFVLAILIPIAIFLPFLLISMHNFVYQVVLFQFERSLQSDGMFSLYGLIWSFSGFQLQSWIRITIVLAVIMAIVFSYVKKPQFFIPFTGLLLFLSAFVLPTNGFWNYYLPACAILYSIIPLVFDELYIKTQKIKWRSTFK